MPDGRVAFVSGATGLLGQAICVQLAQQYQHIIGGFFASASKQAELVRLLEQENPNCQVTMLQMDLSDAGGVDAAFRQISEHTKSLDAVVLCAGLKEKSHALMAKVADIESLLQFNLTQQLILAKKAMRKLMHSPMGRLVFIGSYAGGHGLAGQSYYAASKAGLWAWVKSVVHELRASNLTVNVVSPGAIFSEDNFYTKEEQQAVLSKIGLGRFATVDEVAKVVSFICSENASYIHGADIAVDGGAKL